MMRVKVPLPVFILAIIVLVGGWTADHVRLQKQLDESLAYISYLHHELEDIGNETLALSRENDRLKHQLD